MGIIQFPERGSADLRDLEPHEKWSPRRSFAFIVGVSLLCWVAIGCVGCFWA